MAKKTPEEKFWDRVQKGPGRDDCWEWQGFRNEKGYGQFTLWQNGKAVTVKAHRWSYEMHNGALEPELLVMHLCDNTRCVNPDHLDAGSNKENMKDMRSKGRARLRAIRFNGKSLARLSKTKIK